ncbi:MAG: hypothetical protein IJT18_05855 [Oscillospiraceae bacterium]|nr:hypothetical protein [Oscillospiraceae bacterium]
MTKIKQPTLREWLRQVIRFTPRQFFVMILGNLVLALGVAMFGKAGLGNHPYHTMLYAAARLFGGELQSTYALCQMLLNIPLFLIVFFAGRKHIGLGSILNMFLLGYAVKGFDALLTVCGVTPAELGGAYLVEWLGLQNIWQLVLELAATVVISLGISMYQAGDMGAAPYDALPLIAVDHGRPFAPWRMLCDGSCLAATIALLLVGGWADAPIEARIGLGTVITVFCTGPFIRFFDRTVSCKLAGKPAE